MKPILFHFYQAKKAGIIGFLLYIWLIISFLLVSACFLIFVVLLLDHLWEFFFYDTSFIRRKKPPSTQSYDIIKKLNLPELIRENVAEPRIKDVNNIPKDDTTRMSLSFKFAIAHVSCNSVYRSNRNWGLCCCINLYRDDRSDPCSWTTNYKLVNFR